MRIVVAGSIGVALAGCGDNRLAHPDGVRSGSRLAATFLADAEGARVFQAFHDRELDLDCWFQGDPPRCLPSVWTTSIYGDEACTEPLYARLPPSDECAVLPGLIAVLAADGCGGYDGIWELGLRTARDTLYVIDSETGDCAGVPANQAYEYYAAGDELPLDSFVAGRHVLRGDGQVRERVLSGDDGSERPVGLFDVELDSICWFDSSLATCVPDFVWQSYRTDDVCATPIGGWTRSECYPVPAYTGRITWDDESTTLYLHELGADVAPTVLYSGTDATECAPITPEPDRQFYLAGPVIDAGRLATLERTVADERRLQGSYIVDGGGLRSFDGNLFDRDLELPCYPHQTGADRWHCLPWLPSVTDYYFDDPACTQRIDLIEASAGVSDGPAIAWQDQGPCGPSWARPYDRGPEIASGSIYMMDTDCVEASWDTALVRYYAVGEPAGFDDYVELTLVTE